jgi:Na+/H+ antiporter NhaC
MVGTFWALIPAIVAIALALITKEVYSSLFVGIVIGGIFYAIDAASGFSGFFTHIFSDGMIAQLSDSWNVGILVFLVVLGIMVALMNKAGGSQAFGRWAKKHIKSKVGVQCATVLLGIMIFIDDYFNCLTVGSVMKPVSDKFKVSKEKLAFLIDATAAPICIIAPISSWAAAVAGFVSEGENGFTLFCSAIPFNFYAILTIIMVLSMIFMKFEFGEMSKYEKAAEVMNSLADEDDEEDSSKGKVIDLVMPIFLLILFCVIGMIYTGGFFDVEAGNYHNIINSFADCDASVGLVLGSFAAFILTIVFYLCRKIISFKDCMSCVPDGFKAMVPAILILTLAWTLKAMTDSLGAADYVAGLVAGSAEGLQFFLPAIIFIIGCFLAFATGTSWGTFGILIPICIAIFPVGNPLRIISISACMAGAVCGDHCSPISDTTIMASAGAQSNHINHVNTQLPYAITVAAVSFVTYIVAGFVKTAWIALPVGIVLMVATLLVIRNKYGTFEN